MWWGGELGKVQTRLLKSSPSHSWVANRLERKCSWEDDLVSGESKP